MPLCLPSQVVKAMSKNPHFEFARLAYHLGSFRKNASELPKPVGIKQLLEVYHLTFMKGKGDIEYVHPNSLRYGDGDQEGLSTLQGSNRKIRSLLNKLFQQVDQDNSDLQLTKTIQLINNQILVSLWLMGYDLALRARFHRLRKKASNRDLSNQELLQVWQDTYLSDWRLMSPEQIEANASKLSDSINQRFYLSYKKALKDKGKVEVADEDLERIGAHLSQLINQFNRMYKDVTSQGVRSICLKIATELYSYLWWVVVSDINEHGDEHEEDPDFEEEDRPYL